MPNNCLVGPSEGLRQPFYVLVGVQVARDCFKGKNHLCYGFWDLRIPFKLMYLDQLGGVKFRRVEVCGRVM